MNKIRVTKKFSFEMAHALEGHDGKCRNIHGHSYYLFVTLIGKPIIEKDDPKNGMVMDFADLKEIVNNEIINPLDHALMLYENSEFIKGIPSDQKLIITSYNPTCENMVIDFAAMLKDCFPTGVVLHSLKLEETKTSYAEWHAADQ